MNVLKKSLFLMILPSLTWAQVGASNSHGIDLLSEQNTSKPVQSRVEIQSFNAEKTRQKNNDNIAERTDIETLVRNVLNDKFNDIKYNELRDVMKYDDNLPSTSRDILIDIHNNPSKYAGAYVDFFLDKGQGISEIGPVGHVERNAKGKKVYRVSDSRPERRKDAILSVSYERVLDTTGEDQVFDINLLLFIHSTTRGGYYFRKINVQTNWKEKISVPETLGTTEIAKTTIKKVLKEIPLSDTDFELRVELATQKVVLYDRNHGITRVLPVTAGALDVRTGQIDQSNIINSMTLLLPGRSGRYKDFNFGESAIYKRSAWRSDYNQSSRLEPSYYKGRPFIGIVDKSQIPKDGTLDKGYRGIGFHYQIDDGGLKRGFESHGCLRLQDYDLYTLDAILNAGPKESIPVEVRMKLNKFHNLDNVYAREENYNKVVYSSRPNSPQTIKCPHYPSYPVRFFDNGYHTLAGSDCLTRLSNGQEQLDETVAYLLGQSSYPPHPLDWGDANHTPIQRVLDEVKSQKYSNVLGQSFSQAFPGSNKWIGDLNQDELNKLLVYLKANLRNPSKFNNQATTQQQNTNDGGLFSGLTNIFRGNRKNTHRSQRQKVQVWPKFYCPRSAHQNTLNNLNKYKSYCAGKVKYPNASTPKHRRPRIQNCKAFFKALSQAQCGYR